MRILKIIILLSCLGISYTVAQRRHQNAAETQPETAANPVAAIRGRGRARFVKTPEFEQVSSDYAAASRSTTNEGRSEGNPRSRSHIRSRARALGGVGPRSNSISTGSTTSSPSSSSSIRRVYEVQEIVDDIPDRSALYHRPRVITEDKFELPNAPKSKLFDSDLTAAQMTPEPIPVDQLIKNFGSLKSDEPTKVELPQILLQQDESEGASSSSTISQELSDVSSSTTEKEMAMELMKKEVSTKKIENSDVSSTTTSHIPRRTVVRGRSKQKPTEASSDTSSPSPPVRTRGRSRPVASVTESSPTASRRASSVEETSTRGSFRVGRRRPTQNLRDRGPVPTEEDSLSPKTRTGRDSNANPPSRRGSVRNFTPRSQPEVTENTPRPNRADVRRSRGRKLDSPLPTENTDSSNKPTEFASRRTRTRPPVNNQPIQEPTPLQSRTSPRIATETPAPTRALPEVRSRSQSPQNNDPTIVSMPQRNSRGRARSRFQLDIENTKLEPQPSIEHSTRAVPRRAGRTRAPAAQPEELIASSTVENPIRVTLPPTSTIRSVNSIPTRVKESVHSEVSEVISRKVMRRKKPAPTKVAGKKSLEVDDDIDELNYPPQFKAIILANKSKDEKEKKPETNEALSSAPSKSTVVDYISTTPIITTILPILSTSSGLLTTTSLFPLKHVEDVDNDLAPKSTLRPTRRRFSASTRKPHVDSKVVSTRKPAKTLPTRKLVANPDSEKLAKFHAHFNTQFQQRNHDDSSTHAPPGSTTKRTTKQPSKFTHPRKTDTKTVERRFNQQPTKSNRYSSRYRGEAARPSIPTRAATTSPIYIPTVPTVTPSALGVAPASQSTHQAPEKIDAETDDIKIISIAEPKANSLYSDNLVTEINTVVTAAEQPAGSILERIINSISSISTTTSKPDAKVTSTETAIFRIPPPSPKLKVEAGRVDKQLTTEKPTTIIERILNSLSAIQASDNNVGDKAGNELDAKLDQVSSLVTETSSPPAPVPSTTTPTTTTTTRSTTITTTTVPPTTTVIRLSTPAITSTVRVAPAPTNKPFQSTVAISLADFLASLGNAKPTSPTTTPASTTSIIDENKNTIDYLGISTTTEPATTTTVQPTTNVPTTAKVVPTTTTRRPTTTLPITTTVIPTTNSWILKFLGLETTTFMSTTTFIQDTTVVPRVDTTTFKTTVAPKTTTMMDSTTESTSTETISTSTTTTGNTNTLTANALNLEITTPIINVSPNSVSITSPSDVINQPVDQKANSNNRTGRLLERLVEEINNEITSSKQNNPETNVPTSSGTKDGTNPTMSPEDYFIFAVLPNNTIVRKRPRKISAPYFIYGVYPNNTIIRKFPNGTLVPDDPVVQVSGFDTRDPLPLLQPRPMITSNRGTDDAREVSEVNLLSLDLNNDTETLLTGKTLEEYTSIFDQTITTAPSTSTESTISTTPVSVTTTTNNPTTTNTNPTSQEISNSETTHLTTTIPTTTSPTVESTPQTITEESDIISTEMSIDMTTLNIPMIIELGPETSTLREEIGTTLIDNVTEVNPVTSSTSKVNIETTILDLPETTTNLAEVIFESKNSFENEDFKTIEDFEDTTLPMPDTSTIVMTSTSTPDTTIAPTITPKSSTAPISTDWTIIPSSIHTTTLPATGDDLENEIRNAADLSTSRIVEVSTTPVAATTTSVPTTSRTTTRTTTTEMPTTTTRMTTTQPTTTTRRPTTTTQRPTTTRPRTTTTRPTTTTTFPTTTTYLPPTTTDLTTFIANILSTLRPVYTPTTVVSTFPTLAETTTIPTVTITARRRTIPTTSPTEHSTTVRAANVRRRTMPYTTTEPTIITRTVPTTPATTTFKFDSTTLDPTKVDIDEIVRKSKKKLTPEQLREIEQLKVLEREQANLLKQLSLLTANLNLNGQPKNSASNTASSNLANRIVNFAKERDPTTTEFHIYTEIPTTRIPKKLPALDSKGTTVEDILKELNALQNGIGDSNGGGRSQEAIIAEILKQRGIVPSTPKSLRAAFTTTPATTKRPRTTTTQRPGRIMQGLSWLLNQFAGGPPPAPAPAPASRPRPTTRRTTTTTTTTTNRPDYDELHFQSTEVNNVIRNTPATTSTFKRPVNSLSDDELSRLIKQLEAIQRDPKLAQNLDISPFRKLQAQQTTLNNKNVEIFTTGGGSNQVTRNPKAVDSSRVRTAKSTTSNSIEDLDEDNEVTTARVRATQAPRARVTLPPVELNHVPGIEDNSQGPPIGGNFLNAAVNVTRALSTFLGAAIQGAARSFQSALGSGSSSAGGIFRASG